VHIFYFRYILILFIVAASFSMPLTAENNLMPLAKEDRDFWNKVLEIDNISNKNLLYASYVAYRDRLNDLSIETFHECIRQNGDNERILAISHYYIGKNWYQLGDYQKALTHFLVVPRYDLGDFTSIKYANYINLALTFHQKGQDNKARIYLQKVKTENSPKQYQEMADTILIKLN